jgi:membrane-associated phospholipid phosphatase
MVKIKIFLLLHFTAALGLAQKTDSTALAVERYTFKPGKVYIPAVAMTAGILFDAARPEISTIGDYRGSDIFGFGNHLDDYAQFAPLFALYGFEIAGMKPRTDWQNRTAILIKSQALNLGMVYILKKTLKKPRPDGSGYSFPSGHTANAFAGATMLSIEYGENHRWVPYASYALATGIGLMRMDNQKHYFSDVLFGAGLGILSMKIAYWTHQYKWTQIKTATDPFTCVYMMPTH